MLSDTNRTVRDYLLGKRYFLCTFPKAELVNNFFEQLHCYESVNSQRLLSDFWDNRQTGTSISNRKSNPNSGCGQMQLDEIYLFKMGKSVFRRDGEAAQQLPCKSAQTSEARLPRPC